ncbi:alpha/beta fold hydrolase [Aspergillus undulatus]|uniref:alpha/beta fold hydrolase n=1 Tax=Aspergillus undulatus TaxID=1810928 RepID=UPI003CCDA587
MAPIKFKGVHICPSSEPSISSLNAYVASQPSAVGHLGNARIFVRVSPIKDNPPLLLLHGFPQTHAEWHKLAPLLLPHFTLILIDLRGYGASSSVLSSTNGSGYTKRLMGQDCISVMDQLGYQGRKFAVLGHDRGARVAYRLAFDEPERISRVIVVDIVPTASMFGSFGNVSAAMKGYHWLFLAQPAPFPEEMIKGRDGGSMFLENGLKSWTAAGTLSTFDNEVLEQYREAYVNNDEKIHTTCEDYRAGVFFDRVYDEEDLEAGRKIQAPLLAVWGESGLFAGAMKEEKKKKKKKVKEGPLDVWQRYCVDVKGKGLNCGHFVPEEDPEGLATEVLEFLL